MHNSVEDDQEWERREYTALSNSRMYLDILKDYAIVRYFTRVLHEDGFYKVGHVKQDTNVDKFPPRYSSLAYRRFSQNLQRYDRLPFAIPMPVKEWCTACWFSWQRKIWAEASLLFAMKRFNRLDDLPKMTLQIIIE